MIHRFSTLHRVLFCLGIVNLFMFGMLYFIMHNHQLDNNLYLILSVCAGLVNYFWIWFLLRKAFNSIKTVTEHLKMVRTKDVIKIEASGHQKEINELIHAFNNLADEVHHKSKAAEKLIKSD